MSSTDTSAMWKRSLILGLIFLFVAYILHDFNRPDVLLVGNITVDVVENGTLSPGGSVSYAASVFRANGIRACVVTVAGPDADLSVFEGMELHVIKDAATLTFHHTPGSPGGERVLRILASPSTVLSAHHVPRHCWNARVLLLGPLTQTDMDIPSFLDRAGQLRRFWSYPRSVGLMAQGLARAPDSEGIVLGVSKPPQVLLQPGPRFEGLSVFLSVVETGRWTLDEMSAVAGRCGRLVVTHGERGAAVHEDRVVHWIDAVQVEEVKDTNGAGDAFAAAFILAESRGASAAEAGAAGAAAAGFTVSQPQHCKPHCAAAGTVAQARALPLLPRLQTVILDLAWRLYGALQGVAGTFGIGTAISES